MIGGVGFFDLPDAEPDEDDDYDDEDAFDGMRPAAWAAGVVPIELVIAKSEQAAVVVRQMAIYPDGFDLTVQSHLHRSVRPGRSRHWMMWHHDAEPDPHGLVDL